VRLWELRTRELISHLKVIGCQIIPLYRSFLPLKGTQAEDHLSGAVRRRHGGADGQQRQMHSEMGPQDRGELCDIVVDMLINLSVCCVVQAFLDCFWTI
jgi:hypothetical protein